MPTSKGIIHHITWRARLGVERVAPLRHPPPLALPLLQSPYQPKSVNGHVGPFAHVLYPMRRRPVTRVCGPERDQRHEADRQALLAREPPAQL